MRILSVGTVLPYPPDHATRNRAWHLVRRLAASDDVTFVTFDTSGDPAHVEALREAVPGAVVEPLHAAASDLASRARRWARALAGGPPPYVQALGEERPTAFERIAALHAAAAFDVVVAEDDAAGFLVPPLGVPVAVHRHNVFTRTLADLRRGTPTGWLWPLERPIWRRYDAARTGDLLLTPTDEAAEVLREAAPWARVEVVPNGVEVPADALPVRDGCDLVFIGSMDYAPNAQAVEWFVRHVWPPVRARVPEASFLVIGRGGPERLGRLHGDGVRIVGYAPDLGQACRTARAGVVPLRAGFGIKTKTLDLLALGLPVVATTVGAESIPDGAGGGLVVADDPHAFAAATVRLLDDPSGAAASGAAGRAFVTERFSWDASARRNRELLAELAATPRVSQEARS